MFHADHDSQTESSSSDSEVFTCIPHQVINTETKNSTEDGTDVEYKMEPEEVLKEFDSVVDELKENIKNEFEQDVSSTKPIPTRARKDRLKSGLDDIHEEVEENCNEADDAKSSSDKESMVVDNEQELILDLATDLKVTSQTSLEVSEEEEKGLISKAGSANKIVQNNCKEKIENQAAAIVAKVIIEASNKIKSNEIELKQNNAKMNDKLFNLDETLTNQNQEENQQKSLHNLSSSESQTSDSSSEESDHESNSVEVPVPSPKIYFLPSPPLSEEVILPPPSECFLWFT